MKKYTIADMYTDEEFSKIVEQSSSIKEVVDRLGYSTHSGTNSETVKRRINRLGLDTSHFFVVKSIKRTPENTFVADSTASQHVLRRMYKKRNRRKIQVFNVWSRTILERKEPYVDIRPYKWCKQ